MHLILTHEQADFDAIGALLGAHLMQERTYPVLPRRLNRNVKAFLTLYGSEFPFVEINDLPVEPIESITLVDTQSLVTLRGMNPKTIVHVVDHHSLRPDLSDQWNITLDQTGACTTMFIEGLREQNDVLNPVHATLLLLGIYEDTGSMIFASTTARDARAVSYLLEKGASLQVASRYLNPGLSIEQRAVYDRLLLAAEDFTIKGQHIIVASDNAPEMTDEISSIAHKLRDLLDPSALFLLIQTGEGIRLVARSTTSQVDVSGVAAHFGGGGHDRASAALIKLPASGLLPYQDEAESPFSAARRELIRILPEHIRSSTSVRQIMSRHPLLLAPDTPAEKALNLMQRYGYEGYPIVKDGRIIGLLNRRAVDRAVAHHLNLPVSSLMEVGDVVVHPDDTIEHLRDVMINSGWGQVPVIDPESGEITGIVTRTDLLKHLTGHVALPGRHNMAKKLETALQPARLALLKTVAAEARLMHLAVYIVGGFVRDLLLDRPSLDFDIVVEGDAIALARALEKKYGGRVLAHSRFGTSKWNIAPVKVQLAKTLSESIILNPAELPENLDLISARQEFYDYPTALPTVERSSIKLDLHRRDFTINTIALRLDGSHYSDLYDYWGGLRDLQANLVRVLHSLSFVDDPTRQLRAVRFEQRFNFQIDERTLELMTESRPLIRNLSGDRLRHELNLILEEERAIAMLLRLNDLGLLSAIHPELPWSEEIARAIETALNEPFDPAWGLPKRVANLPSRIALAYLMWLETLPVEKANHIAERLRLPGSLHTQIGIAIQLQRDLPALIDAPPSLATQQLESIPILALFSVYCLEDMDEYRAPIERYVASWRHIQPTYTGEDLRLLGIPPGPIYKKILTQLRAAWLDGLIKDHTGEQLMFNRLVAEHLAQNRDSNG
jgi:tRNA nucleotidyltransferase (CCA-adding enzyme)